MSYYQCPKCGGRDTYHGTELVSDSKGGGAIIGPENDLGFSPVVGVGGRTTTSEQTVVKCKACNILLGKKDFHYSQEEIDRSQEEIDRMREEKAEKAGEFRKNAIKVICIVGAIIYFVVVIVINM